MQVSIRSPASAGSSEQTNCWPGPKQQTGATGNGVEGEDHPQDGRLRRPLRIHFAVRKGLIVRKADPLNYRKAVLLDQAVQELRVEASDICNKANERSALCSAK